MICYSIPVSKVRRYEGNKMKFAVIPAYEPDEKLTEIVSALNRLGFETVAVDDGSGEAYAGIFQETGKYAHVISCPCNCGKGHALKTAFSWLADRVQSADTIVTLDCDGQHRLEDAVTICNAARQKPDTLFLGSRKQSAASPLRSRFGNAVTRKVFQLFTGVAVYDTQTGLRAFSARLLPEMLEIPGERYEYEMNVLLHCSRQGIPMGEIPVKTVYIDGNASSHFRVLGDSWLVYREILKFSASSLLGFLTDYALYSLLIFLHAAPLYANIAARCVSAAVNFSINRRFVFQDRDSLWESAVRYFTLALGILACNSILLCFFTTIFGVNPWLAKLMAEMILFLCSYLAQKKYVFIKKFHCREGEC